MGHRILLVEDTPDLLQHLVDFLEMEGFIISPCLSAQSALGKIKTGENPDLILTDLTMPDMDGFELIEEVKQMDSHRHIPIVIFSARPLHENQARAQSLGVTKYINKPCSPDDLLSCIQEILIAQ